MTETKPRTADATTDTNWLVEQLQTASVADLVRIADAALTWAAIVQATFQKRYPEAFVIWTATTAADVLSDTDQPRPPTTAPRRRH